MSAEWNYAVLTRTAAAGGGPEQYLRAIKVGAAWRGGLVGAVVGGVIGGVVGWGVERYRTVQAQAREAEQVLLAVVDGQEPRS